MGRFLEPALAVRRLVLDRHERGGALQGPDPIGKVHWRITRFVRSYVPWLPGDDNYVFYQGLAYWVLGHLDLGRVSAAPADALDGARRGADFMVESQRPDGAWDYPSIFLRKGKLATVEGAWAALALLGAYRQFGDERYLQSARRWHDFMIEVIGFTRRDGLSCINYYQTPVGMIPNNATLALWLNAELADVTGDAGYMDSSPEQVEFLVQTQMETGELPYAWPDRPHLYCYQYNSFEFLDLLAYHRLTHDPRILALLKRLSAYLAGGVTAEGACKRDCFQEHPEVTYWTLALATALSAADRAGLGDHGVLAQRALDRVLQSQRRDGGFDFSRKEYGVLTDRRSYPRYLAMMFHHLVMAELGA